MFRFIVNPEVVLGLGVFVQPLLNPVKFSRQLFVLYLSDSCELFEAY